MKLEGGGWGNQNLKHLVRMQMPNNSLDMKHHSPAKQLNLAPFATSLGQKFRYHLCTMKWLFIIFALSEIVIYFISVFPLSVNPCSVKCQVENIIFSIMKFPKCPSIKTQRYTY